MFVFKPTTKTYSDPQSALFIPGVPFGPEYSKGDIAFLHEEFPGSKMFFNSKILRQAILDSKDYLEEVLGIEIKDVKEYVHPGQVTMEEVINNPTNNDATTDEKVTEPEEQTITIHKVSDEEVQEKIAKAEECIELYDVEEIPKEEVKKSTKKK